MNVESLKSFIDVSSDSHFPIQNLPFGAFKISKDTDTHLGVAIGDYVLDLTILEQEGLLKINNEPLLFAGQTLNVFLSRGKTVWGEVRKRLIHLLQIDTPTLRDNETLKKACLRLQSDVLMQLPVEIGDYTDFYSSEAHASNLGRLFRDKDNPLLPNWKHIPVAYHGRASSIVISGTPIKRPSGQIKASPDADPIFSLSKKLDFELEMGFLIGEGNRIGSPIAIQDAHQHIFGFVIVNDWSARDIQQWEYQPLGPFLGKNFATSISPWIVTIEALSPFRIEMPAQTLVPLEYLQQPHRSTFNIHLSVDLKSPQCTDWTRLSESSFQSLYWSIEQQLAHHTVNGCNMRPGDLLASGTISGEHPDACGSLIELTQNGTQALRLRNGEERRYLEDGDEVCMTAWCQGAGYRVGFGSVSGQIVADKIEY